MFLYRRQSSERFLDYRGIYFYRLKRFPFHQLGKHRASGNEGAQPNVWQETSTIKPFSTRAKNRILSPQADSRPRPLRWQTPTRLNAAGNDSDRESFDYMNPRDDPTTVKKAITGENILGLNEHVNPRPNS